MNKSKYIIIYIALLVCYVHSQVTPHLPTAFSLAGTREFAAGLLDSALIAVKNDSLGADSLLRLYKLGVINAHIGNAKEAIDALNAVSKGSQKLAPFAMEQIGDIAAKQEDFSQAIASYASALGATGLPPLYQNYLFAKVKNIASKGVALPKGAWVDGYRKWERNQKMFTAAGLEAICDSLITAGNVAEADSLLAQHLPEIAKKDACRIVDRLFQKRPANDTAMVSTRFLFTLSSQAAGCRNFVLAEKMLTQAQRRTNFSTAVPVKASKLLAAQVAYGREQWQKAIDLYKKYDTEHGADSEALTHIARAYRSLGNTAQMAQWQETHIKRFPESNQSQEILWLRAWNLEQAGDFKSAAASYKRILSAKGKRTEEAYVRHALCYYKMGKFDSVIVHLAEFRKAYPSSSYLWSGLFWQGKAHIEAGRTADAHKIWKEIIQLDPADYHAHRAKQLMGMVDSSAAGILMPEHLARAWLDSIPPISQRKKLSKADSTLLGRGAALLSVARTDVAAFFLDDYEKNYPGNLLLQYDLACAYEIAGSIAQGFRAAWRLGWRIPTGYRGHIPLQIQAKIYPSHYLSIIRKYAERFKVDPLFVISVMRQESIFDSSIISHAGAIGLMQVIPPTGKLIAGELNEKNFANDSLHKPEFAVRYGTYYLRKRMNQFNNNMVLTLGAYNGGAHNVVKWIERNPDTKSDIFVEDIGFLETRLYVKKVMGYYWTYQQLMSTPGYDVYFK